jgi:predicted AAA+ superfamily ATPase
MAENNYFSRSIDKELLSWSKEKDRKTLLLRGARQVGKSSAVRNLGKSFKFYVEINFDDASEQVKELFKPGISPQEICMKLSALTLTPIVSGETLLFLDEIQSCPSAISKLRYFYEQYPELHVIAAGSLLEFALEELSSFGVGRIRSMFMYPFSFEEFLIASGKKLWAETIREANPQNPIFEELHSRLINHLHTFNLIGGMPAVVTEFIKNQDFLRCQNVLNDILVSFHSDFAKYKKRVPSIRINEVFEAVAKQAEGKFVYERAAVQSSHRQVKDALELLVMAGLVYPVTHTSANGIPLGAEINPKIQRMFLFDTGLFQRMLGLNISDILLPNDFKTVNRGALAEIFVALEIVKASSCYTPANLYYWQREKSQSNAQIDFLVQKHDKIIPIEVKSGTQGAMQSLRLLKKKKKITKGIRTSLENFAQYENIEVFPMYAISNLIR